MKKTIVVFIIISLMLCVGCSKDDIKNVDDKVNKFKNSLNGTKDIEEQENNTTIYIPDKLRIASFDIDGFNDDNAMSDVISAYRDLIFDYDIIAIQNFKGNKELIYDLIYQLNMEFKIKKIKDETMIFIYNKDYLTWRGQRVYDSNKFFRNPYGINFEVYNTNKSFTIVQVHLNPTDATEEIKSLREVFEYFAREFNNDNIIITGNMYADCYYYNTQELEEYFWVIDEDTLRTSEDCAFDRIIVPEFFRANVADYGVDNYIRRNYIDSGLEKVLSEHYPVYLIYSIN